MSLTNRIAVSVVIPCFCCGHTVRRAVDSVLCQSALPAELILVDDASGDNTISILRELKVQYPCLIRVVELLENSGAACARNAGWDIATQPYIAFLDADDTWDSDKLRIQYEFMCENTKVALSGHLCIEYGENNSIYAQNDFFKVKEISALGLLFKTAFSTPTVMLRSNIPFRFQTGKRYAEDAYLWQQVAFAGLTIVRFEVPLAVLYKARYGAQGLSSKMWDMERGELGNFLNLRKAKKIGNFIFFSAVIFSLLKYFRRVVVVTLSGVIEKSSCWEA